MLNLPEAFGSAYVGETFSCTLCANNELYPSDTTRAISGVRIQGDMQTPSAPNGSPLDLSGPDGEEGDGSGNPGPGESLQRILRFELKEEGNHVLAVTVTYTETTLAGEGRAASGRVRTFRKLYQFVAQQLLSVRTKAGEVSGKDGLERYLLEAQLENMGESAVSLEVSCCKLDSVPRSATLLARSRSFFLITNHHVLLHNPSSHLSQTSRSSNGLTTASIYLPILYKERASELSPITTSITLLEIFFSQY